MPGMNLLADATIPADVTEIAPGLMVAAAWTVALFVVGLFFCARALRNDWSGLRGIVQPWDATVADFGLFVVLFLFLYLGCSVLIGDFLPEFSDTARAAISGGLTQGCFLLTLGLTARIARPNFWHSLNVVPMRFFEALRLGVVKFLACFPLLSLTFWGMGLIVFVWGVFDIPYKPTEQDFVILISKNMGSSFFPLFVALTVVVAPITEELLFRGVIYRFLKGRMRPLWALVLANILFGLIHVDLFAFLPLCAAGMFFTWAYERTGNIAVPIVCHALLNANTLLLLLLQA